VADDKHDTSFRSKKSNYPPMPDRPARSKTSQLGAGWKLQIQIDHIKLTVELEDDIIIGRATEQDVNPKLTVDLGIYGGYEAGVSRKHAIITRHEGGLYIEDLGSMNGTRINGFELSPNRKYRLRDNDEVEFAQLKTVFRFIRA